MKKLIALLLCLSMVLSLSACGSDVHSTPEKVAKKFLDCVSKGKTDEINELFYTSDIFSSTPAAYFEEFYGACEKGYGDDYKIVFSDITVSDIEISGSDHLKNYSLNSRGIDASRPIDDYKDIEFKWSVTGSKDSSTDNEHSFMVIKEDGKWYIHDNEGTASFTLAILSSADELDYLFD